MARASVYDTSLLRCSGQGNWHYHKHLSLVKLWVFCGFLNVLYIKLSLRYWWMHFFLKLFPTMLFWSWTMMNAEADGLAHEKNILWGKHALKTIIFVGASSYFLSIPLWLSWPPTHPLSRLPLYLIIALAVCDNAVVYSYTTKTLHYKKADSLVLFQQMTWNIAGKRFTSGRRRMKKLGGCQATADAAREKEEIFRRELEQ